MATFEQDRFRAKLAQSRCRVDHARLVLQRLQFEQNGGFNQLGASDTTMAFEYLFVDAPGKPSDYTLVYETPGAVSEIPLEFEFKDVPLP